MKRLRFYLIEYKTLWRNKDLFHIVSFQRQYFVYHLRPNALYQFKLWATNRLGSGEPILLYISTDTVQKKSVNVTHNAQTNSEDSSRGLWNDDNNLFSQIINLIIITKDISDFFLISGLSFLMKMWRRSIGDHEEQIEWECLCSYWICRWWV